MRTWLALTLLLLIATAVECSQGPGSPSIKQSYGAAVDPNDCTWEYTNFSCPDLGALLAFKAANLDPFHVLSSWTIPCNISLQSKLSAQKTNPSSPAGVPTSQTNESSSCKPFSSIICNSWFGVNCTAAGRVRSLVLNNPVPVGPDGPVAPPMNLWGNFTVGQSIPPEFGDLSELEYLDLSNNFDPSSFLGGLIGPLPQELSRCAKLTYLDLQSNRFWGQLPDSLGALLGLQMLNLHNNNFTGSLPGSLGNLSGLTYLRISQNYGVTGALPSGVGGMVSLLYLNLGTNSLDGPIPDSLSKLSSLTFLDLHSQSLSGPFPSWIGSLKSINYMDLSSNNLNGTLPDALGTLWALNFINLFQNALSGPISASLVANLCSPARLNTATNPSYNLETGQGFLYNLDLASNNFSGSFPYGLKNCAQLGTLYLANNSLEGTFPAASFFTALPLLSVFSVESNQLTGGVPQEALTPMLGILQAAENNLTGPMPVIPCINSSATYNFSGNSLTGSLEKILNSFDLAGCTVAGTLVNLTLDFSNNQLTGGVPADVFSLPTMSQLNIAGNQLNGSLDQSFNCSAYLTLFSAASNRLTGRIPPALGSCKNLQVLNLAGNNLSGNIPQELKGIGNSLQSLELQGNSLSGPVPPSLNYLQQLRLLNLSHNSLSGTLPIEITQFRNLGVLDLSSNQIAGPIPDAMNELVVARSIDLHSNALSGAIPISLAPPNLALLTFLDLSSNALSGPIPWGFANSSASNLTLNLSENSLSGAIPGGPHSTFATTTPPSSLSGNADLCGGAGYPACPDPTTASHSLSTGAIVGICVGAVVGLLLILGVALWFIWKRNEWAGGTMLVFEKLDAPLTVDDILEATEKFDDKYKLGRGGFGTVYRATLPDGRTVAIKRLASKSAQGDREFQAEMQTLGNIRHRNLVVLVAAYIAPPPSGERLLVYNFLSGGSLDSILSGKDMPKDSPFKQWELRRSIALDIARGLKYLHHDCTPRIIHRDMKPANILLDDQNVAHVADFGLAREVDASKTHMSTAVFGTIGYLAPEYTQRGRLTFKSDVFAYGVLLLQLITGKQPTDEDVAERGLARWVGANSSVSVIDRRMEAGVYSNQILGAVKLGLLCTSRVPADRPSMAEVVHLLENLDDFAKGITNPEDTV